MNQGVAQEMPFMKKGCGRGHKNGVGKKAAECVGTSIKM